MMRVSIIFQATRLFTLIEMLVVIAIIGILASMLMPSLQKALNTARGVACMNNQKQIGTALTVYSNDYDGWIPGCQVYGELGSTIPWSVMLTNVWRPTPTPYAGVYMESTMAFFCPSGVVPSGGYYWNNSGGYTNSVWNTYGMVVAEAAGSYNGLPWTSWTRVVDMGGGIWVRWMSPTRCATPSKMAIIADTAFLDGTHDGISEWMATSTWGTGRLISRHSESVNLLFGDGHSKAVNGWNLKVECGITKFATEEYSDISL